MPFEVLDKDDWDQAASLRAMYSGASRLVLFAARCFHRGFSLKCAVDTKVLILATDMKSFGMTETAQAAGRAQRAFGIGAVDFFSVRTTPEPELEALLEGNDEREFPLAGVEVLRGLKAMMPNWQVAFRRADDFFGFHDGAWRCKMAEWDPVFGKDWARMVQQVEKAGWGGRQGSSQQ